MLPFQMRYLLLISLLFALPGCVPMHKQMATVTENARAVQKFIPKFHSALSPQIFAMMVLMALVTTFMTGPSLDLINRLIPEKNIQPPTPVAPYTSSKENKVNFL